MKKIKIGIIGADVFEKGILLVSQFKNAELFSVFETNKFKLRQIISSAMEKGLYVKSFNNADDFYKSEPDIVLIGKAMNDYILHKNSYLADGFCEKEQAIEGIAAEKDGKLYFFHNNNWTDFNVFKFSASEQLEYIKSEKNPLTAFFILKQHYEE